MRKNTTRSFKKRSGATAETDDAAMIGNREKARVGKSETKNARQKHYPLPVSDIV